MEYKIDRFAKIVHRYGQPTSFVKYSTPDAPLSRTFSKSQAADQFANEAPLDLLKIDNSNS